MVDASYVGRLLQGTLDRDPGTARAHLVLCAGPFGHLALPTRGVPSDATLIRPFDVGVSSFRERGARELEIVVPFEAQAAPAVAKWVAAGFRARPHVLTDRPPETALPEWLASRCGDSRADVLVFDYVGFPAGELDAIADRTGLPVFDLGHMALDALDTMLHGKDPT